MHVYFADRGTLGAAIEAARGSSPELEAAIALQHELLGRQLDLLDVLRAGGLPALTLPPRYLMAKLGRGVPAFHGEPVPLPAGALMIFARDFCERLARGGGGEGAAAILHATGHGFSLPAVLSACFGRDQARVRGLAAQYQLATELVWMIADLTVAPLAAMLALRAAASLAGGAATWTRGFCPACGSWPTLVEVSGDARTCRCGFCGVGWTKPHACAYCGNAGDSFFLAPGLQLCGACGGYLKEVAVERPIAFPLAGLHDVLTTALDVAATQRRYVRPAHPSITRS